LLDVGGVGSLGVHTCCERASYSLAVSFCFFFAVGWGFDDDAFRRWCCSSALVLECVVNLLLIRCQFRCSATLLVIRSHIQLWVPQLSQGPHHD